MRGFNFISCLLLAMFFLLPCIPVSADDSCIFAVTAEDVPPNVVILLDNGPYMKLIQTHADYVPTVDYPVGTEGVSGFYHDKGYTLIEVDKGTENNHYVINKIDDPESINGPSAIGKTGDTSELTWMINSRTVTLPRIPVEEDDGATDLRYSKNYLNWIFFGDYNPGTDGDLPANSSLYLAKQALLQVAIKTKNKAKFGIYSLNSNTDGATSVQPLKLALNSDNITLTSAFSNQINLMKIVDASPLAEGLQTIGEYYASPSSGLDVSVGETGVVDNFCQKSFVIVVTPGISSEDQDAEATWVPAADQLADNDYDADGEAASLSLTYGDGTDAGTFTIPVNLNGSTHLDDIAKALFDNDVATYNKAPGFQNVLTYTIGLGDNLAAQAFLINTSNNGNGNANLYNTDDPDYGKYHFQAADANELANRLDDALGTILENTASFTAPVVPVTRTSSGDYIYLSFFKPLDSSNFWQGDITKYTLDANNDIIGADGNPATESNGAMKLEAVPFWSTLDWASTSSDNYMANPARNIYTYRPDDATPEPDLTDGVNAFTTANMSPTDMGYLAAETTERDRLVNYIRGADAYSATDPTLNRDLITGDALHGEPAVFSYNVGGTVTTRVFYAANDGMLHAVDDSDGTEAWAFIPPDLWPNLKKIVEGSGHNIYLDASPKIYFYDVDGDGMVDGGDKVILIFGERRGGSSYWALDVTTPDSPEFLWSIDPSTAGYSELGESWSEPVFGKVKDHAPSVTFDPDNVNHTKHALFVGGGYSETNAAGRAIYVIDVLTGEKLKEFSVSAGNATGMTSSIVSNLTLIDAYAEIDPDTGDYTDSGYVDKVYVGDLGGNIWRLGYFKDSSDVQLPFPTVDENITNWTAEILFNAGVDKYRPFFYAPDVTLEKGYDVVFFGSGDRENPCTTDCSDRIFAVKDDHKFANLTETDLVVTPPVAPNLPPNLDNPLGDADGNGITDKGWYYSLAPGEKILASGVVYYKVFYITSFLANTLPCVPGGAAFLYGLGYKTGAVTLREELGGGIASKPVVVLRNGKESLLISVGSTNPNDENDNTGAGINRINPESPPNNISMRWWKELFK